MVDLDWIIEQGTVWAGTFWDVLNVNCNTIMSKIQCKYEQNPIQMQSMHCKYEQNPMQIWAKQWKGEQTVDCMLGDNFSHPTLLLRHASTFNIVTTIKISTLCQESQYMGTLLTRPWKKQNRFDDVLKKALVHTTIRHLWTLWELLKNSGKPLSCGEWP